MTMVSISNCKINVNTYYLINCTPHDGLVFHGNFRSCFLKSLRITVLYSAKLTTKFVTGFWKTDHSVTFDITDNSVYLGHSKWYYIRLITVKNQS